MSGSLLQQMQDMATTDTMPAASLLRKGLVLARRLKYPPLGEWAQMELEGYPPDADLPDYRAYRRCQVLGNFNGPAGSGVRNQPLPSDGVEDAHREALFGYELREGIPKYESLVAQGEGATIPWNTDFVVHYQAAFFEFMALSNAWREVGRAALVEVIEGVRTRLLNFCLDIEATNPEAGEAEAGTTPVPAEEVSAAFQLNIMGDNNVVTTAGRDVSQQVSLDGPRWDGLRETLADLGVPGDELIALKDALEDDVSRELPAGSLGPSTATWLERINEAIKTGAVAVGTDAAGGLIAIELLKFLGAG
jgi:hypothetical protein